MRIPRQKSRSAVHQGETPFSLAWVVGGVSVFLCLSFSSCEPARASEVPESLALRAIIGEASDQGFEGMTAVAEAIRNRGTLKGVYGVNAKHVDKQPEWVWDKARQAWNRSKTSDLVHRADHWENTKAFGEPYWAKHMVKTAQIKDHAFYRSSSK